MRMAGSTAPEPAPDQVRQREHVRVQVDIEWRACEVVSSRVLKGTTYG